MEIEFQLIPDSVRFAGFENFVPPVAVMKESSSPAATPPGQGIPLSWKVGGVAIVLCVVLCIVYHVNQPNDDER